MLIKYVNRIGRKNTTIIETCASRFATSTMSTQFSKDGKTFHSRNPLPTTYRQNRGSPGKYKEARPFLPQKETAGVVGGDRTTVKQCPQTIEETPQKKECDTHS